MISDPLAYLADALKNDVFDDVDNRLNSILGQNKELPPIILKSSEEYAQTLFDLINNEDKIATIQLPQKIKNFAKKFVEIAIVSPFIPDTIFVNIEYFTGKIEPLEDYKIARSASHEGVHVRLYPIGILGDMKDRSSAGAMLEHPIFKSLNEGAADYISSEICGDSKGRTSDSQIRKLDRLAKAKCILAESKLGEKIEEKRYKEIEEGVLDIEAEYMSENEKLYCNGRVFMHIVSKYLSETEAIGLAINPLKEGVDINQPTNRYDDNLFRVSEEEIKNPEKYVLRRLEEQDKQNNNHQDSIINNIYQHPHSSSP